MIGRRFNLRASVEVPEFVQRVTINGAWRPDVFCTAVNLSGGTGGSTAQFVAPGTVWDSGKAGLRGAAVEVAVGYYQAGATIFCGIVTGAAGGNGGDNQISFDASSLLALSDCVYLGQELDGGSCVVDYTGRTCTSILRDIFNRTLPSQWRSKLDLGLIDEAANEAPVGDIVFRQATLRAALDQVLGLVGTLSVRESFRAGGKAVLEVFKLADESAPVRRCVVARPDAAIAGTNILTVEHNEALDDVRTRLIGMGDFRKYVLSVTTAHPTHPLQKLWQERLEPCVLAAPDGEADGSGVQPHFYDGQQFVFRRYGLPECLREYHFDSDNAIETTDGSVDADGVPVTKRLAIQVWKYGRTLVQNADGTWTSTANDTPELIDGADLHLDQGFFLLKKPAVNLSASTVGSAAVVTSDPSEPIDEEDPDPPPDPPDPVVESKFRIIDTYVEAVVGITLTVVGDRLQHDTEADADFAVEGIETDGLTEIVVNDSFKFAQVTNDNEPIGGVEFDCAYYLEGDGWVLATEAPATALADDTENLRTFTEAALAEKNKVRATYTITTPYATNEFKVGDRVEIVGQSDFEYGTHQILSVAHTLGHDHSTTISTDNAVPMTSNEILSSGGGQ